MRAKKQVNYDDLPLEPEETDEEILKGFSERDEAAKKTIREYETMGYNKLILKYSIPSIVGLLCNGLQNIVNRIFVGQAVGSTALAAVVLAFPVMTVFIALSVLIGVGASTLIGVRLGQHRIKDAEKVFGTSIVLLFLFPIIACIICFPFLEPILIFLGADSAGSLPYAMDYMKIFLFATIFFLPSGGLNNIIRVQGAPMVAMGTQILASGLNVVFNWLFVMVLGWGVKGAALGVLLGNFISLFWIFGYFMMKKSTIRIHARYLRVDWKLSCRIMAVGIAPFLIQLANTVQTTVMNRTLAGLEGDTGLAVMSVVGALSSLLIMPMMGINNGLMPIISYNYGARMFDRLRKVWRIGIYYATAFALVSFACTMLFPDKLAMFFTKDAVVVAMAAHALRIFFLALPILGYCFVGSCYFQATGQPVQSTILSLSRQLLIYVPLLFILPNFMGIDGCWWSAFISDSLSALLTIGFNIWGFRKLRQQELSGEVNNLVA